MYECACCDFRSNKVGDLTGILGVCKDCRSLSMEEIRRRLRERKQLREEVAKVKTSG